MIVGQEREHTGEDKVSNVHMVAASYLKLNPWFYLYLKALVRYLVMQLVSRKFYKSLGGRHL